MATKEPKLNPKPQSTSTAAAYAHYSGIALQFVAIIVISTWFGHWLDVKLSLKFPAFTLVLAIVSAASAIYLLVKKLQ